MFKDENRIAARAAGAKTYAMTRPCQRGHLGQRYTSCGSCVDCLSATGRYRYKPERDIPRSASWRAANPHKRREYRLATYGLTPTAFDALLAGQEGRCKVCRTKLIGGQQTHVDHCHESGVVRGILCARCNTAIGLLDDSPDRAEALAGYLRGFL